MTTKLREISEVRQVPGEPRRRWFTSESMDLIVWVDKTDHPTQLQLCYDKGRRRGERAFTWTPDAGYALSSVDDGEIGAGFHKATPILIDDCSFDKQRVTALLLRNGKHVPAEIIHFVTTKIQEYHANSEPIAGHHSMKR